jgi:hypothetical protein
MEHDGLTPVGEYLEINSMTLEATSELPDGNFTPGKMIYKTGTGAGVYVWLHTDIWMKFEGSADLL